MEQSNNIFSIPEEIKSNVDDFFIQYNIMLSVQDTIINDEEKIALLDRFNQLEKEVETPLYLLEIIKRILVDGNENYGNVLTIVGHLNKLIESKEHIQDYCNENKEYNAILTSSISFLLPYSIKYFVENFQDDRSITCFDNLFKILFIITNLHSPEFIALFNQYIDSLLSTENFYQNIIALKFANEFELNEENKEKILEYINYLIDHLQHYDFNEKWEIITYDFILTKMRVKMTDFLHKGEINREMFLQSIISFFDSFISKFNPEKNFFPETSEIELTEKVVKFLMWIIKSFESYKLLEEEERKDFISQIVGIVYEKALNLIYISKLNLPGIISEFFLRFYNYLDFTLIYKYKEYFVKLIYEMSCLQSINEIMDGPEENLYIDYYDIDFDDFSFFSNKQNVAQLIHSITMKASDTGVIVILVGFLDSVQPCDLFENHFFILSVINNIAQIQSLANPGLLETLYKLLLNFLTVGTDFIDQNRFSNQMMSIFTFSYLSLMNSSFYVLEKNIDKSEINDISNLYNEYLTKLMIIISNFSMDKPYDDFYRIYFTFFCTLSCKMIENEMITIDPDKLLLFTNKYSELSITSDATNLIYKIADAQGRTDIILETLNTYLEECMRISEQLKEQEKEEEDENKDKKIEHIIRCFNENVSKMSDIFKDIDISCFDENAFVISKENKLVEFSQILITTDTGTWTFMYGSIEFFSALFSKVPNTIEWINFYLELVKEFSMFGYDEWPIPVTAAISCRPELVDQEFIDYIFTISKDYIENSIMNYEEEKTIDTKCFLYINSLISRLFELQLLEQIQISEDVFSYFSHFVLEIKSYDDYDDDLFKISVLIFKLTSFLVNNQDKNEIGMFIINSENEIICQEMRYIIIFLIDIVLEGNNDEKLGHLRRKCLINDLNVDDCLKQAYKDNISFFCGNEPHPIFKIYPIDGFVFDD